MPVGRKFTNKLRESLQGYVRKWVIGNKVIFIPIVDEKGNIKAYSLDVVGGIKNTNYIQFDISYTGGHSEGRLHWNSEEGTLEVGMPGGNVNMQIGMENLVPRKVKNTSGVDIKNGQPVYLTGGSGVNAYIALADTSTYLKSKMIGLATEDIDDGEFGWVTTFGVVRGDAAQPINTSTYSVNDILYLGLTPGNLTSTEPNAPNTIVRVGLVWRSHATEGEIFVFPIRTSRLSYLSDVQGRGSEINNAGVIWKTSASRYELQRIDFTDSVVISTTTVSNTTDETTIFTAPIAQNELMVSELLKFRVGGYISNATAADDLTITGYLGTTALGSFTTPIGLVNNEDWHVDAIMTVRTIGATGSVAWHADFHVGGYEEHGAGISTIDTTTSEDFTVTVQWDNAKAGNTISAIQGYMEHKKPYA